MVVNGAHLPPVSLGNLRKQAGTLPKSIDDRFLDTITTFIAKVNNVVVTKVQKDLSYFSHASRECDEYLSILRLKVTEPNTGQKWVSQYEELLDLSGRLQNKIESFGDVPLASHPHRFAIEYLHSIVLFRALKDCQDKIQSNAFSVPEAEDLYMRYTDEKTRIEQGSGLFVCSDKKDSLLAVTLLLTTLKLHVALSKKAVHLIKV